MLQAMRGKWQGLVLFRVWVCLGILAVSVSGGATESARGAENPWITLARDLEPALKCVRGQRDHYTFRAEVEVTIGAQAEKVTLETARWGTEEFRFRCTHADYAVEISRLLDRTVMALPRHEVAFVGAGEAPVRDHLLPKTLSRQLIDADSMVSVLWPMLQGSPKLWPLVLSPLVKLEYDAERREYLLEKEIRLSPVATEGTAEIWKMNAAGKGWQAKLSLSPGPDQAPELTPQKQEVSLERAELERQLTRGARRALAVLAPSPRLLTPVQRPARVENGELRWVQGQRLALLKGSPEEIGKAHAQLLGDEATRCLDSVLYAFGTVQTIRTGRWFRHDLEEAYARLQPHIPEDHQQELAALANELGWEPHLIQVLNVFPELFHCSGFAVYGSATQDGVLYHGRVLDYMTTIGLQDSAVTFVVAPNDKIPFVNVGYGGFGGSVSGMNARGVSLGEMGGRGEGEWDGVPMATLMRRALEECRTLDEVMDLWTNSPRTCEYFYVFAEARRNGNQPDSPFIRRAVGVAATPESLQFVQPGEAHELLGPGIPDVVYLSAGQRLETLRGRIQEKYGQIDSATAIWLMSRPVAMQSNLHNVLFVPEQGKLHVANANHQHPAAERPYVEFDITALLQEITDPHWPERESPTPTAASQ